MTYSTHFNNNQQQHKQLQLIIKQTKIKNSPSPLSGYVQIWDLATSSPLLVTSSPELQILPFRSFKAHQRMVMHCQWNDFLPTTFSTAGYDKQLKFWNLANAGKPFFQVEIGPVTACQWTGPLNCGVIVAKDDGYR